MLIRPLTTVCAAILLTTACTSAPDTASPASSAPAPTPFAPATTGTSPAPTGPSVLTPVVARPISTPIPVPATDGKVHLAYELALTNTLDQEVTLTSLDVRAGDRTLLSLPGERLADWTRLAGSASPTRQVGPAQTVFVWLDVALNPDDPVPSQLTHAVGISLPTPNPPLFPATLTEDIAPVTVQTRKPIVISPPLAGPNWLDGNSCCEMTAHRMALNPINGDIWVAERFAIDYVQLDAANKMFTGPIEDVNSFAYFGADILAVGDGPVVATVDGLPEQVPGASPTGLPLDQYGGNHIVQDLGDGHYALYAHLKTGSVKVKQGDQLTTGQVIGSLGNSGNSDAPHLHFHIMNTPDPLRSDGLPFVFSSFGLTSRLTGSLGDLLPDGKSAQLEPGFAPRDETNTSPLVYDVMSYEHP